MTLAPKNTWLLDELEPYVVATPENLARFDLAPFGIDVRHRIDPLHTSAEPFLDLLKRLDESTFGPEEMPMPRWIFVDGAELTGGIVGLGLPASKVSAPIRERLAVPDDYDGLVPYAMYIAIPTYEPQTWVGHNLASIRVAVKDDNLRGLGSVTKAIGLAVFRCTSQVGATQWDSHAIHVHVRLGSLALLTAWTPAHTHQASLTYRVDITERGLRNLARDPAGAVEHHPPTRWIDHDDVDAMKALQTELEAGASYELCGPPERTDTGQRVPIRKLR